MKNIFNKRVILLAGIMIFLGSSCDDVFDINQSPNNPAVSTPELTLPVAIVQTGHVIGLDFALLAGFMAQYITQAPQAGQYEAYDRYNYTGNNTSSGWDKSWYGALADYQFVKNAGISEGKSNHAAVATLLMAYQFQVLVDAFDRIPFDDALKGADGVLQPQYESGQDVYDKIITLIDEGIGLIVDGGVAPGGEDIILNGDMAMWRKFANTLKLRVYMRQTGARPGIAETGIRSLISSGVEFLGSGEDVFISYPGSSGNENPLYSGDVLPILQDVNINGSLSVIGRFQAAGDPRLDFYYDPSINEGLQVGIVQGGMVNEPGDEEKNDFSTLSSNNIAGAASPVYLMTGHESLFLQAEASERGWGSGDAASTYNMAVQAAFTFANGGDASSFTTAGGAYEYQGLVSIHTQKWIAMAGTQWLEGWAEFRRTDTPALVQSVEGVSASLNGSTFPRRAFYPTVEVANNPNTPENVNIGIPVWWDVSE